MKETSTFLGGAVKGKFLMVSTTTICLLNSMKTLSFYFTSPNYAQIPMRQYTRPIFSLDAGRLISSGYEDSQMSRQDTLLRRMRPSFGNDIMSLIAFSYGSVTHSRRLNQQSCWFINSILHTCILATQTGHGLRYLKHQSASVEPHAKGYGGLRPSNWQVATWNEALRTSSR